MSYRYVAPLHLLFTFSKPMSADIKSNKEEKTDLEKRWHKYRLYRYTLGK